MPPRIETIVCNCCRNQSHSSVRDCHSARQNGIARERHIGLSNALVHHILDARRRAQCYFRKVCLRQISVITIVLRNIPQGLIHLPDELVNVVFTVAQVAALHKVFELPSSEATRGVAKLEWPQEVGNLLEVWSGT